MQTILDIAYSNVNSMEQILRDVLAIVIGYGVPIFGFLLILLFSFGLVCVICEMLLDSLIARKNRITEKVALLDNGDN